MSRRSTATKRPMRGAVIASLIVLAIAGFCLFDGDQDGDHHAGSLHVCLAMLVNSLMPAAIAALLAAGAAIVLATPRVATVSLGVALPPPKSTVSL